MAIEVESELLWPLRESEAIRFFFFFFPPQAPLLDKTYNVMKHSLSTLEASRLMLKQTGDVAVSQPGSTVLCTCVWFPTSHFLGWQSCVKL